MNSSDCVLTLITRRELAPALSASPVVLWGCRCDGCWHMNFSSSNQTYYSLLQLQQWFQFFTQHLKNGFHRDEASSTLAERSTHKHTAKCQCHYLNATNTRVICRHCCHSSKQRSKIIPQCWNFSAAYFHVNNVQACREHPPAIQRCEVRWAAWEHQWTQDQRDFM